MRRATGDITVMMAACLIELSSPTAVVELYFSQKSVVHVNTGKSYSITLQVGTEGRYNYTCAFTRSGRYTMVVDQYHTTAALTKISPPPGFEPRIVQRVDGRYTDYAVLAASSFK